MVHSFCFTGPFSFAGGGTGAAEEDGIGELAGGLLHGPRDKFPATTSAAEITTRDCSSASLSLLPAGYRGCPFWDRRGVWMPVSGSEGRAEIISGLGN